MLRVRIFWGASHRLTTVFTLLFVRSSFFLSSRKWKPTLLYTGYVGVCVCACLTADFFGGHTFVCAGVWEAVACQASSLTPVSPTSLLFQLLNVAPPGISCFPIAYWQLWALTCCLPKLAATSPVSLYTVLAAVVGTSITAGATTGSLCVSESGRVPRRVFSCPPSVHLSSWG